MEKEEELFNGEIITQFADELLEYIFCLDTLDFKDILKLSETCKRFYRISQSCEIWERKLQTRWKNCTFDVGDEVQKLFKEVTLIDRWLKKQLDQLGNAAYDYEEVPYSFLSLFYQKHASDDKKLSIVLELLYVFAYLQDYSSNIHRTYYAKKAYRYTYHEKLRQQWIQLLDTTDNNTDDLERGAVLMSQWCNTKQRLTFEIVSEQINTIASIVKEKLVESSFTSTPSSRSQLEDVVKTINSVIYDDLQFKGNSGSYYDIKNSFIDKVLERKLGIPITLCVLYIAVAKRLGLNVQGVSFPGHFLIRVGMEKEGKEEPMYIDAFNRGALLDERGCLTKFISDVDQINSPRERMFQIADLQTILCRMLCNIINILKESTFMNSKNLPLLRSAHELMLVLAPNNDENKLLLSKIYLHQGINLEEVAATLREMFSTNRSMPAVLMNSFLMNDAESRRLERVAKPKYRSDPENKDVKFKVGMMMFHKRYHYQCVIYGWDPLCRMDDAWKAQMSVHHLPDGENQPFYHVFVLDSSARYAAQENLMPAEASATSPIKHPEVGKYFKSFKGSYYILADKLAECYPEDQIFQDGD